MRAVLTVLAVALVVSGCAEAVEGKGVATEPFDPCALSEEALTQAGALPETKMDDVQFAGFRICSWRTNQHPYYLTVFTTDRKLSEYRLNETKTGFQEVEIVGRSALRYLEVDSQLGTCAVGFDTREGSVHVEMHRMELEDDACPYAIDSATKLAKYLPE
jgi:hypothetical protein